MVFRNWEMVGKRLHKSIFEHFKGFWVRFLSKWALMAKDIKVESLTVVF